jgi:hypothetical protein
VTFHYNVLFAQSATLIAEALIALNRPREALNHAIRSDILIGSPDQALKIAFSLIQSGFPEGAILLLDKA